jgi:hypothetical protein
MIKKNARSVRASMDSFEPRRAYNATHASTNGPIGGMILMRKSSPTKEKKNFFRNSGGMG